jgi:hypothetical protein
MVPVAEDGKVIFWHRDLPPIDACLVSEHNVEADSMRVKGDLAHRNELWDRCHDDLMARIGDRLCQEVGRLGGDYAHVLEEFIDAHHDDASGEAWLHGRCSYLLLRRPSADRTA